MKNAMILLICALIFGQTFGQKKPIPQKPITNNFNIKLPDTLTIKLSDKIEFPREIEITNTNQTGIGDQMPWIAALVIGLITVGVTLIMGRKQIKSSERMLTLQNSTERDLAILDFNKTVISGNRQEWINTLRDTLSEYLARIEVYSILIDKHGLSPAEIHQLMTDHLPGILTLEVKIAMMINENEEDSRKLITYLGNYTKVIFKEAIGQTPEFLKDKIVETSKLILKKEWERVKKGE